MNRTKRIKLLRALKCYMLTYNELPQELQNEQHVILSCLKNNSDIGSWFPDNIKNDKEFFKKALAINPIVFIHMNEDLKKDNELLDIMFKSYASYSLFERVLKQKELANYRNNILEYFPHAKHNKKIVYRIFQSIKHYEDEYGPMFKNIYNNFNNNLKNDVSFISLLVKLQPTLYEYLPPKLQDEPDIMIAAMKSSRGEVFKQFNEELRNDAFFVYQMSKIADIDKNHLGSHLKKEIANNDINSYTEKLLLKESIENKLQELGLIQKHTAAKRKL